jgi:hypothetical protein
VTLGRVTSDAPPVGGGGWLRAAIAFGPPGSDRAECGASYQSGEGPPKRAVISLDGGPPAVPSIEQHTPSMGVPPPERSSDLDETQRLRRVDQESPDAALEASGPATHAIPLAWRVRQVCRDVSIACARHHG